MDGIMPLAQVVNVYFDTNQYGNLSKILLSALTSPTTLSQIGLVSGDTFTLNLWPRVTSQQQGAATTTAQLANPSQLGFTGKAVGNLGANVTLFSVFGFTELQDAGSNYYYQAVLSLNTGELNAAISGKTYLNVLGEIENVGILLGGVTQEQRLQFNIVVYPAVYNGTEGAQTAGSPGYYTTTQADARFLPIAPINGNYEVVTDVNGSLWKLWNPTQNKFQTVYLIGAPGAEQLVIGAN